MPKDSKPKSKKPSPKSVASSSSKSSKKSAANERQQSNVSLVSLTGTTTPGGQVTSAVSNELNIHTSSSSCASLAALSTTMVKNASIDGSMSSTSTSNGQGVVVKPSHSRKDSRSNDKFHQLFPSVPIYETVIDTYSCAYVKSLNLFQGIMYLTNNYICFYSKILSSVNIIVLQWSHINSITKTMHALIFPTAICIDTQNSRYTFTSFRSRSHTYDNLIGLWNRSREQSLIRRQINMQRKQIEQQKQSEIESKKTAQDDDDDDGAATTNETNENEKAMLRRELLADNQRTSANGYVMAGNGDLIRVKQFTNENYDTMKPSYSAVISPNQTTSTSSYQGYCNQQQQQQQNFFPYEMNFGDSNIVTISLRHNKTLLQKVKILIGLLIPGFFDISRIDALLPICFLMCVLLLLNAFVLLNKVNQVDDLFSELLLKREA